MDSEKRRRLEARGWKVGTVQEFLNLSPDESLFVEIKARLAVALADLRARQNLTQVQVARKLGSSQSRVAKMEAADGTVSLDLIVRSLLVLGMTRKEVGAAIARK